MDGASMRQLLLPVNNSSALRRADEEALYGCAHRALAGVLRAAADRSTAKTLFVVLRRRRRAALTITAAEAKDEVALRAKKNIVTIRRRQPFILKLSGKRSPSSARRAPRSRTWRPRSRRRRKACASTRPKRRRHARRRPRLWSSSRPGPRTRRRRPSSIL